MGSQIKCYFLERTNRQSLYLRRYSSFTKDQSLRACPVRPGEYSYHDKMAPFGECPIILSPEGGIDIPEVQTPSHDHDAWPNHCDCGYAFDEDDTWQLFNDCIYKRVDTGAEMPLRDAPAGALYFAWWLEQSDFYAKGPDGHTLLCRTPAGDWNIDQRASNCSRPSDTVHRCWVRHGDPRTGLVHVDKCGDTCAAGAGSILIGNYHGFLENGILREC